MDEQPTRDVVVGVLGDSLRQARGSLVTSLCLVVLLVAIRHDRTVVGAFAGFELFGSVYTTIRETLKFRRRLDRAEPLPIAAVEATRVEQPPLDAKRALALIGGGALAITGVIAVDASAWLPRVLAGVIALVVADGFVRPLAVAYLVNRWERRHGHSRLFRPLKYAEGEEARLYAADRPVPAA